MYECLANGSEFRAFMLDVMEASGMDRETARIVIAMMASDPETYRGMASQAINADVNLARLYALIGESEIGEEICQPEQAVTTTPAPQLGLGMSKAEAKEIIGKVFDCLDQDPELRESMVPSGSADEEKYFREIVLADRDAFITITLIGFSLNPEGARALKATSVLLESGCPPS